MSSVVQLSPRTAAPKDLYEIGEIPPLGHVPEKMYAWAIRKERHGPPETSFQVEVLQFGGTFALTGVNFLMTLTGTDCRDLNTYSYGSVDVNATADTATVSSKDSAGFPIINAVGENDCTTTVGP